MPAARHKSQVRSKSVAARLAPGERTLSPASAARSSAAVSAAAAAAASSTAAAAEAQAAASDFPAKDYKSEVLALCKTGLLKFLKFMPPLPKDAVGGWEMAMLLSRCEALYDSLDPSIRLIASHPQNLLQRKKTLACNIAFSVCPYADVNPKGARAEFNRLFQAQRNGPTRLTEEFVPATVKAHVQKMKKKTKGADGENEKMGEN